jgi:predicted protein tyrosine phosphatase
MSKLLRGPKAGAILQEYPERESNSAQSEKSGRAESQTGRLAKAESVVVMCYKK